MMSHALRTKGLALSITMVLVCAGGTMLATVASATTNFGTLSGVVVDPSGTPQMGANVKLVAENLGPSVTSKLFTNQHGAFSNARVPAGYYELQVSLAGFLPSTQHHIRVVPNVTTLVKVELSTVFASLDRLRRGPAPSAGNDDWKWVLRTSAATRPVLEWTDRHLAASSAPSDSSDHRRAHAQLQLTSGSDRPGSISNLSEAPATAVGYDTPVGATGRLYFAGQMSIGRDLPSGGFASVWMPSSDSANGPVTEVVFRQDWLGLGSLAFRSERISQRNTVALGDRMLLHAGADVVAAQIGSGTKSFRPGVDLVVLLSPNLQANFMVVSGTAASPMFPATRPTAMEQLNNFPIMMERGGRPVLEGGWHEELGAQYKITRRTTVETAAFHDRSGDTAVFGRGAMSGPDFLQDPYSSAFVYDSGVMDSWGIRAALKQNLGNDFDLAAVYAWAGAMAPGSADPATMTMLRDALLMHYRHSLGIRFSGKSHHTGTQLAVSYKWLSGQALSRQDAYGEALYGMDPYLSVTVRQALPGSLWSCRWEALADFRNMLAQGYIPVAGPDGQVVLMAAARSFRGGVSFQF
jgi:hypothetical protein